MKLVGLDFVFDTFHETNPMEKTNDASVEERERLVVDFMFCIRWLKEEKKEKKIVERVRVRFGLYQMLIKELHIIEYRFR